MTRKGVVSAVSAVMAATLAFGAVTATSRVGDRVAPHADGVLPPPVYLVERVVSAVEFAVPVVPDHSLAPEVSAVPAPAFFDPSDPSGRPVAAIEFSAPTPLDPGPASGPTPPTAPPGAAASPG